MWSGSKSGPANVADPHPADELRPDELDALQRVVEGLTGKRVASDTGRTVERRVVEEPPAPWETRDVSVALPMIEAEAMWYRARRFDLDHGGRFEARSGALVLWSGPDRWRAAPILMVWVHWHRPSRGQAELFRVEWDPRRGGSEAEVWRALELLAGRAMRPA